MPEYSSPKLESLINQAFNHAWAVDTRIDWTAAIECPSDLPRADYVDMISQLYHSERFTIQLCARLIQEMPDFQAKQFVCTQMADEARHAQAYSQYLSRIGTIAPINERLRKIFDLIVAWKGPFHGLIVALNVVIEGEALNQQHKRIKTLPCPVFRELNRNIILDEARHAAFGIVYLRDKLPELASRERQEIFEWICAIWRQWEHSNEDRYESESAAVLRTSKVELGVRFHELTRKFGSIGLIPEEMGA